VIDFNVGNDDFFDAPVVPYIGDLRRRRRRIGDVLNYDDYQNDIPIEGYVPEKRDDKKRDKKD
jgi:hypothetical protein